MAAQSKIVKRNSRWFVTSEDGEKVLGGPYKTKEEAEERPRQVEHFKDASAVADTAGSQRALTTQPAPRARYVASGFLALEPRAFGSEFDVLGGVAPKPFEEHGNVAVIRICGPLEQHPNWQWQDYETLRAQADAAFDNPTTRAVALCINSPGGSAAGCFELARALRAMSESHGKPLGVFVDGMAASAAYGLACAATPGLLHAPPTSTVASLAVYEMVVDQTAADAAQGLRFVFIPSSGADLKLTGNSHLVQTEEQMAHTQAQVDLLTDYFYSLVSEMRPISVEDVRGLRGATLLATQGAAKGLVDVISDWDGFLATLNSYQVNSMGAQAKKAEEKVEEKSPWDEALSALMGAAEGDDEDKKMKAKKMLKALMSDDAPEKEEPAAEEPEKEAPAAKAEEPEKEEPAAAGGEYFPKAAAASAKVSNEVALANRVLALEAKIAADAEANERKALLAKRPDFSAEVRSAYAKLPIEALKIVVATAPRVTVAPTAAAAAATPAFTPGQADAAHAALDSDQQSLLRKFDGRGATPTQARVEGVSLVLEHMTPADAAKRVAELQASGKVPMGFKRADINALTDRLAAGGK